MRNMERMLKNAMATQLLQAFLMSAQKLNTGLMNLAKGLPTATGLSLDAF